MGRSSAVAINGRSIAARMRPVAVPLIFVFWMMHFAILSALRAFQAPATMDGFLLLPRALTHVVAIALSLVMMEAHARTGRGGVAMRLLLAFSLALVGTGLHLVANLFFFSWLEPPARTPGGLLPRGYGPALVNWLFIYVGLSAMLMAVRFHADVVDRDLSLVRLDALARDAELRALRYQLNPHFLFNALNSAVALIAHGQTREAEDMIENLSDFLRASLALDADDDIPLARELALQRLYLEVEATRFPNRLKVEFDVPPDLEQALVPSLLLQPLVENAIRFSVAESTTLVTVTIEATRARGQMRLVVRDDGETGRAGRHGERHGTGVGLANVAGRLRARYGDGHHFLAGPAHGVGFVVAITLPLRLAPDHA